MPQSPKKPRRSKPKFEVPAEMEAPEATTAWAYRTEEAPGPTVVPITLAPSLATVEPPAAAEPAKVHPLVWAGAGMVLIGIGSAGMFTIVALEVISTPVRLAKAIFGRRQRTAQ